MEVLYYLLKSTIFPEIPVKIEHLCHSKFLLSIIINLGNNTTGIPQQMKQKGGGQLAKDSDRMQILWSFSPIRRLLSINVL